MGLGISVLVVVVVLVCYLTFSKSEQTTQFGGGNETNVSSSNYSGGKGGVNNPGFLIHTDIKWKGKTASNGCKFENFSTLGFGVRAWYVNLFGKVKNGQIHNTNEMIDILTPAIAENPENARINYKKSVAKANNWIELGVAVFDFEANSDWKNASVSQKTDAVEFGFREAVSYKYNGQVPNYFK